jgi:hypothetical protein
MKKLVIIPGGFHPFHAGHMALYRSVVEKYPNADVYVAATDDKSTRPFPFALKQQLASLAGVPVNRFIQVKSPFQAKEITQIYDPDDTVLIFVRSEKDATSQPQPGQIKKDGTSGYLQANKLRDRDPMSKHGYMDYMPTVQFGGMTSATEIRNKWPGMEEHEKANLIATLYPATKNRPGSSDKVIEIFDTVLGTNKKVEEAQLVPTETGVDIVVDGLGTFDEDTLVSGVKRGLAGVLTMLEQRNYSQLQYVLQKSSLVNRINALAQYERFMSKQGNRPLAKDKTVDISNEETVYTIEEEWSDKYKKSIDCSNPKGFSQRAHCAGRKKK